MDVTNLTAEQSRQILDFVLAKSFEPVDYLDFEAKIIPILIAEGLIPDEDKFLLRMVLNKLNKDGFVDFYSEPGEGLMQKELTNIFAGKQMSIRRNFNGHIFLANGGYKEHEKRRIENETNRNLYDGRMETYAKNLATWTQNLTNKTDNLANQTRRLKNWTIAVAVGAIGLVLWEIAHTIFFEHREVLPSFQYFHF